MSDSGSDTQFLPVGTPLYTIPSNGLILAGDSGIDIPSFTNPLGINSDGVTLLHSIDECPNGIKITFSSNSYYVDTLGASNYTYSIGSLYLSKGSTVGTISGINGYGRTINIQVTVKNGILSFAITYPDIIGASSSTGTHDTDDGLFFVIASITAY